MKWCNLCLFQWKLSVQFFSLFTERLRANIYWQKQPFVDVLQNRCSEKFCNVHRKTTVLDLQATCNFIKKRLQHRCFPVNIGEFLRTASIKNTSGDCFCLKRVGCSLLHPLKIFDKLQPIYWKILIWLKPLSKKSSKEYKLVLSLLL